MKKNLLIGMIICLCMVGCKDKKENEIANTDGSNAPAKTFSVASDVFVKFSQGNLRYNTITHEYRFSENQYDMLGKANYHSMWSDEDTNPEVWQDLFYDYDLNNGVVITNAGNVDWNLLSNAQWEYLLAREYQSRALFGVGIVNGVNGIILLPDNWDFSAHTSFNCGFADSYDNNNFSIDDWKKYETDGAAFLPASGKMSEEGTSTGSIGEYWTGTLQETGYNDYSYFIAFKNSDYSIYKVEHGGDWARAYRFVEFVK